VARDGKVDRLRQVYLFSQCSDKDLKKIAGLAEQVDYGPGHVLCAEGRLAQECYVLIEGEAEVRIGDRVVATVGPGVSVGEMGLINRQPRSATVVTTSPVSAYVIEARRFTRLLEESPAVCLALLQELRDRLRSLDVTYTAPAAT
jgi:CRP-like cAMP-binding protein